MVPQSDPSLEQFGIKSPLAKACIELIDHEESFNTELPIYAENITTDIGTPTRYVATPELYSATIDTANDAVKKFIAKNETNASVDINIEDRFSIKATNKVMLSQSYNKTISDICDATLAYLANNDNLVETIAENRPDLIENKDTLNKTNDPALAVIRHFQQYPTLLGNIQKGANQLNETLKEQLNGQNVLSKDTMDKLSTTLKIAETATNRINTRLMFGPNNKGIVEILDSSASHIKLEKPLTALEAKDITTEIINTISNQQPKDIANVLAKHGFTNANIDTANEIKQGYYFNQINNIIRNKILDAAGTTPLHAKDTSSIKIQARLHGYASSTQYLIANLNKAYMSGDSAKVKQNLENLGLNSEQIKKAMITIEPNMPKSSKTIKQKKEEGQKKPITSVPKITTQEKQEKIVKEAIETPRHIAPNA